MNIILIICKEGEIQDTESLLGHLAITDGSRSIKVRYTYIDTWLDALIRGLTIMQKGASCSVDLVDEPEPLAFHMSGDELWISYSGATVNVGPIESFATALRAAADLFVGIIREEVGSVSSELLLGIQAFVSHH
jgi:hypothetical protein